MAIMTITIPDDIAPTIIQQYTDYHGYGGGNGSRAAYFKEKVIQHVRESLKSYRQEQADRSSRGSINQEVDGLEIS